MRDGVLVVKMTTPEGPVRLATQMYADNHVLYRGHLKGFSQSRKMTDALTGRTSISVAALQVHNENEERDAGLIDGSVDICIGDVGQPLHEMAPVMLDAQVAQVQRSDNQIDLVLLDGQARTKASQQRLFAASSDGIGPLLPELWGIGMKFQLINTDGDDGKVFGCVGPMTWVSRVYVGDEKITTGYTFARDENIALLTFTEKPEGSPSLYAKGLGSERPGNLIRHLLTRVASICQGKVISGTLGQLELDARIDDVIEAVVGKVISIYPESGSSQNRTISAFDAGTRTVTFSPNLPALPTPDDFYSIEVETSSGGFSDAQIELDGFYDLNVAYPTFPKFGLIASGGISTVDMLDKLLKPLLCHVGPKRNGMVQLRRLELPTGDAAMRITRIIGQIARQPMPIYWRVEARFYDENIGGDWRSVSVMDAGIKDKWSNATTLTIDVPTHEKDSALAAAQHHLDCFGVPTEICSMKVDHDLTQLDLGDVVEVVDSRYQFKGGKKAVVVSMTDHFGGYDDIGVWVEML